MFGAKRRLLEKADTFQYVPLIENLQWLLQNRDIYNEVIDFHSMTYILVNFDCCMQVFHRNGTSSSEYLYDFCDGCVYKEHPLLGTDGQALQLIIYYDDVEVANPLGSYRGQHKLGMYQYCKPTFCNFALCI